LVVLKILNDDFAGVCCGAVDLVARSMYGQCMPYTTITVNLEARKRLEQARAGKESLSEVILRQIPEQAGTCGELLDILEARYLGKPIADPKLMAAVRAGRSRRSNRRRSRAPGH
jgi:predicted CopG family antitoxin